ncbi:MULTISPECIES: MarR family winged helix-turn-helix transcriptional regulator [Catenuloplanes]|uniref:DNA-binding MarR family transcriptional regulator n=1 Tax=Catenuloplanes niger TaxID=587534 RepID=A0AAE4D0A8_9ACTN|nr:MarR family winged helix-turn-helix transcriptional regulator [Catenuloplanes niger]MDR7327734.1 DNA-binding MarR family transcriptional regulator [Catenuloplanes niger]
MASTLPPQLTDSTPYLLTRAVRKASRLAAPHFAAEPLRFPHYVTLCWAAHLDGATQRELAGAMDADPSDLVTVLAALEDAGLLTRTPDPADRRRNLLAVTAAGHAWLTDRHARARAYDAALCATTPDDGDDLRAQLRALLA